MASAIKKWAAKKATSVGESESLFSEKELERQPAQKMGIKVPIEPKAANMPLSQLQARVLDEIRKMDPEMFKRYGASALLDAARAKLDPEAREDLVNMNRLKKASIEAAIDQFLEQRQAWVRKR